jgi:uncharacterized protein
VNEIRTETTARLLELERDECFALLAGSALGRLAVSPPGWTGAPVICPVSYVFDRSRQAVVFRSARGSKMTALLLSREAAFEVDGVDPERETGWSVIARGPVEEITTEAEIERARQLGLRSWAPGEEPHWMRIRASTVTGRRISF